jgi:hypothetical protein
MEDFTGKNIEAGVMAGANNLALGRIPLYQACKMGANGGISFQALRGVDQQGRVATETDHLALAFREVIQWASRDWLGWGLFQVSREKECNDGTEYDCQPCDCQTTIYQFQEFLARNFAHV